MFDMLSVHLNTIIATESTEEKMDFDVYAEEKLSEFIIRKYPWINSANDIPDKFWAVYGLAHWIKEYVFSEAASGSLSVSLSQVFGISTDLAQKWLAPDSEIFVNDLEPMFVDIATTLGVKIFVGV